VIRRSWHKVIENRLKEGACPDCGQSIPGRWTSSHVAVLAEQKQLGRIATKYDALNL
jgi:hypothetical protein